MPLAERWSHHPGGRQQHRDRPNDNVDDRGEVRRDLSAADLARLTQMILFGVTLAWAMNPDSSLRATEGQVWDLFAPNLLVDEKSRMAKGQRSSKS